MQEVAVIGTSLPMLLVALYAAQRGARVTIYEREIVAGGVAWSNAQGESWPVAESAPHILPISKSVVDFLSNCDIEMDIESPQPQAVVDTWWGGAVLLDVRLASVIARNSKATLLGRLKSVAGFFSLAGKNRGCFYIPREGFGGLVDQCLEAARRFDIECHFGTEVLEISESVHGRPEVKTAYQSSLYDKVFLSRGSINSCKQDTAPVKVTNHTLLYQFESYKSWRYVQNECERRTWDAISVSPCNKYLLIRPASGRPGCDAVVNDVSMFMIRHNLGALSGKAGELRYCYLRYARDPEVGIKNVHVAPTDDVVSWRPWIETII